MDDELPEGRWETVRYIAGGPWKVLVWVAVVIGGAVSLAPAFIKAEDLPKWLPLPPWAMALLFLGVYIASMAVVMEGAYRLARAAFNSDPVAPSMAVTRLGDDSDTKRLALLEKQKQESEIALLRSEIAKLRQNNERTRTALAEAQAAAKAVEAQTKQAAPQPAAAPSLLESLATPPGVPMAAVHAQNMLAEANRKMENALHVLAAKRYTFKGRSWAARHVA